MRIHLRLVALCLYVFLPVAAVPAAAAPPALQQDEEEIREFYTGTLVGLGGAFAGRTSTFTLTLTGHTPRSQAERYVGLLRKDGQQALMRQLEGKEVGRFALTGQVGRTVNFAYVQHTPEGTRLMILFERWLQPFEVRYGTRSQNYPFSYLELSIDRDGKGGGTFIGAAKVYFEKDDPATLNVENFSTYPLRAVNVALER